MIQNIIKKLSGELPVTREDLIELINSWGRLDSQETNDEIQINKCEPNQCYPLENLDVSKLEDLSSLFRYSMFNGDLSNWDVSNCKNMEIMFARSRFNNDSLQHWDVSNVTNMNYLFISSNFNGNISSWNIDKAIYLRRMFSNTLFDGDISKWNFNSNIIFDAYEMFEHTPSFTNKYNKRYNIPNNTKDIIKWFEKNREKIRNLNTSKEDVLDFFSFEKNIGEIK